LGQIGPFVMREASGELAPKPGIQVSVLYRPELMLTRQNLVRKSSGLKSGEDEAWVGQKGRTGYV
jgi:hypothetical protein